MFLPEFHILLTFCYLSQSFYTQIKFSVKTPRFTVCTSFQQNGIHLNSSRWQILLVSFLVITDVIMTSLLLLKIIYVLANFRWLYQTLLFYYFSFYVYFEEIWILPINSTMWRHNDVILRHCVNQVMFWKWWVHYWCNLSGHRMSGCEVPGAGSKTKAQWVREGLVEIKTKQSKFGRELLEMSRSETNFWLRPLVMRL